MGSPATAALHTATFLFYLQNHTEIKAKKDKIQPQIFMGFCVVTAVFDASDEYKDSPVCCATII